MFKKKPVLQYESAVELYPNIVTPAKNHVPEWYKKIPKWKNNEVLTIGKGFNPTLKQCLPFFMPSSSASSAPCLIKEGCMIICAFSIMS